MYIIIMDSDKQLIPTIRQAIYRGENMMDDVKFLLPLTYKKFDLSEFTVVLQYIQKLVKSEENRATGVETGIDSRLKNVETSLGNSGSVNEKISEAINALDYTYDGIATDIVVGVSQVDGVISVEKADLVFATENQIKELFSS